MAKWPKLNRSGGNYDQKRPDLWTNNKAIKAMLSLMAPVMSRGIYP